MTLTIQFIAGLLRFLTVGYGQEPSRFSRLVVLDRDRYYRHRRCVQKMPLSGICSKVLLCLSASSHTLIRCGRSGEAVVFSLRIVDKITEVKRQLATAEDVLEVTAQALQRTAVEVSIPRQIFTSSAPCWALHNMARPAPCCSLLG